jgi:dTDP-glucose 4,6-dehydratase
MSISVLVTGGAGFIGSNFIHLLVRERSDWRIVNLDALTYAGNLENLSAVEKQPGYKFVHGDIRRPEDVARAFDACGKGELHVVHFAAESHVDRSIVSGLPFVETNVLGTQVLLDQARARTVARFVHVSTDEVYGSLGAQGFFTEETPLQPNSPYSASKAASDMLVRAAVHTHGFPALTTRCSNNYGPYQFPEKLIPLMIANAAEDKAVPVYGDGMNVRDWLYVRDHAEALWLVLNRGRNAETYNIGGHNEWANINIVKLICDLIDEMAPQLGGNTQSLISYVTDRPGHDRRYAIDAGKLQKELGWVPAHTFEKGIRETVRWYLDQQAWVKTVLNKN